MGKIKRSLNTVFLFVGLAFVGLAMSPPVAAAPVPLWPHQLGIGGASTDTETFCGKGANNSVVTSVQSNMAYFITSVVPAGTPQLTAVIVNTDLAGNLQGYTCTNSITVTNATSAGTNTFLVPSTATISTNDILVFKGTNDTYQLLVVSNVISATSLGTYQTTSNAVAVGDVLYEMTPSSVVPLGNANLGGGSNTTISTASLLQGQLGKPLLITATGSNSVTIQVASGLFFRRLRP